VEHFVLIIQLYPNFIADVAYPFLARQRGRANN